MEELETLISECWKFLLEVLYTYMWGRLDGGVSNLTEEQAESYAQTLFLLGVFLRMTQKLGLAVNDSIMTRLLLTVEVEQPEFMRVFRQEKRMNWTTVGQSDKHWGVTYYDVRDMLRGRVKPAQKIKLGYNEADKSVKLWLIDASTEPSVNLLSLTELGAQLREYAPSFVELEEHPTHAIFQEWFRFGEKDAVWTPTPCDFKKGPIHSPMRLNNLLGDKLAKKAGVNVYNFRGLEGNFDQGNSLEPPQKRVRHLSDISEGEVIELPLPVPALTPELIGDTVSTTVNQLLQTQLKVTNDKLSLQLARLDSLEGLITGIDEKLKLITKQTNDDGESGTYDSIKIKILNRIFRRLAQVGK